MRREDKERVLTELVSRVVDLRLHRAERGGTPFDEVVAESIWYERRRLKTEKPSEARTRDRAFWDGIQRGAGQSSDQELVELLRQVVRHYGTEICGNFDPRVYGLATKVLPSGLSLLLTASSPKRLARRGLAASDLDDTVRIRGRVEHLRRLCERGTVIMCPTHVSNLDSIIIGYAIYRMGLPPFVYGAGLNLFTNPMMSFFMHNLGAYTVDRRKKDPLYKEVLKNYATLTLEHGYPNLFFPGGTRCRSGAIERKLKLGLLGTSVAAYIQRLRRGLDKPNIYIVPTTLSFQLVLEAETLVDDFLQEVGRSRYIISDDEFARPRKVYDFVNQLFSLDSKIYFTVGQGFDPFGNPVDDDGVSLDPRGRPIDIERYVLRDGEPQVLPQRDGEYTRELGLRIGESFMRDNTVQSTNVAARAVLSLLRRQNPNVDLVRLLRLGGRSQDTELRRVHETCGELLTQLRALAAQDKIRLGELVENGSPEEVVADALRHFAIYHQRPAAERRGDRVFATDRNLLFYYANRLEGYDLHQVDGVRPCLSRDHRNLGAAA